MNLPERFQHKEAKAMVRTSITMSPEFYEKAKKLNIKISQATRIGLSIMFAEAGEIEYDNRLNVVRKMRYYQKLTEEAMVKQAELQAKLERFEGINLKKEGVKVEKKDERTDISK